MALAEAAGRDDSAARGNAIRIGSGVEIPRSELIVKASRSGGAGGQHVNKTATRIELTWNIARSGALTDAQRERLLGRLGSKVSADGDLRIVASEMRSQLRNRQRAEERLVQLVRSALAVRRKRKPTKRPRAAEEARLESKKRHSRKKRERRSAAPE